MNRNLIPIPFRHRADSVPEFAKQLPQWIHWAANEEKENGRFNKIPVSTTGVNINAHDPKNWNDKEKLFDSN